MGSRTLAVKVGAGLAAAVCVAVILFVTSPCGTCDTSSISASGTGDDTSTTSTTGSDPSGPRSALQITPSPILGLADSLTYTGLAGLGAAAQPADAASDGESATSSTTADPGATTDSSTDGADPNAPTDSSTDGADPNAPTDSSTDGADPTTPATTDDATATTAGSTATTDDATATTAGSTATTDDATATTVVAGRASTTTRPPTTTTTARPPVVPVTGAVPTNGQVFYVSASSGNDGNDGTSSSSPWRSLATSINRLRPGQTLLVMNGEYRELKAPGVAHYTVDRGGSAGNWMRIAAAPGHNPVIAASNGTGMLIQAPYVEFSGLTIRGSGFNQSNDWGVGIAISQTHNVRVVGNRVSGMPVSGISVTKSTKYDVIGNVVSGNSFWSSLQGSGISVWHSTNRGFGAGSDGYHDRIVGNRVYGNENKVTSQFQNFQRITDGNGIIVDSNRETGYTGRTLVANNLVYDNGGRGVIVWQSDRVDIMFNTGYQNGQTDGIAGGATEFAAGKASDVTIANNVGWARSGLPAIVIDRVNNGRTYSNVLVTDSPSGNASGSDIMHSGNPGFRNPSTNPGSADFRPTSGSVLAGKAQNTPSFIRTDLVGTTRGSGGYDIGAFEAEAAGR